MLTPFIFRKDADVQGAAIRRDLAELNALSVEGVQGLREIITMTNKQRYLDKYRAAMQNLYSSQITYGKRQGRESMLMYMLIGSFSVALMLITASLVNKGVLEFSVYPVVLTLSALLFAPLIEVCAYSRNLGNVFAAADRIQGVFDEKPEVEDLGELSIEKSQGHAICFENVSFSYAEGLPEVLHNISFEIKPGQTVALAGHSGAGKTTCANLLLRYWEPLSGHVLIDDKELNSLILSSLRSCTAAVLQDVYLFNMSIMDNIRLGAPDASDEEVYDAARRAYIDEFIKGLPDGYNTVVGERGSRFSGGQRQRIAIARALLKDPSILILDEAVSNLDAESELYIQKALREHSDGRTTLVIAHRLSTLSAADKIVLLDHGRVVGEGSHDELLAGNSYYRDLLKTQQDEYE
jgi:ABC-type multidrug transport system fused ATPase/permease subunit